MKHKIYVVIEKEKTHFFDSWRQCEVFVKGKSNVLFKGFNSREEASVFAKQSLQAAARPCPFIIRIYTDGSYNPATGKSSWAWVAIDEKENILQEKSGLVQGEVVARNIDGELEGVLSVCEWLEENKSIPGVCLYHDYIGIERWANQLWQAKIPLTQHYAQKIQNYRSRIHFQKVKGHSNDKWNDYVDEMAKSLLNL